jgi:hypothetical protein
MSAQVVQLEPISEVQVLLLQLTMAEMAEQVQLLSEQQLFLVQVEQVAKLFGLTTFVVVLD